MRLLAFVFVVCAAWYYFAAPAAWFDARLIQSVENTAAGAWSALPWPGKGAGEALQGERRRSAALEAELVQLRDRLTRTDAETAAREKALEDAQMASKAHAEAEGSATAHAEALATQLATAERDATHRSDALQGQLGEAETRAAVLSRDKGRLQERLDGATAAISAADTAQASLQGELQAALQDSRQQQDRSRRLASNLDQLRATTATQIADLQGQLEDAKAAKPSKAEAASTSPPGPLPEAGGTGASTEAARDRSEPISPEPLPRLGRDTLAEGIRTHVVVRFSSDTPSAKARAIKLCASLQAQGMLIEQIVGSPSKLQADSLAYFYKSDESRAGLVAALFPEFRSTMRQRPPEDRIPRPGLIEIEVAT